MCLSLGTARHDQQYCRARCHYQPHRILNIARTWLSKHCKRRCIHTVLFGRSNDKAAPNRCQNETDLPDPNCRRGDLDQKTPPPIASNKCQFEFFVRPNTTHHTELYAANSTVPTAAVVTAKAMAKWFR